MKQVLIIEDDRWLADIYRDVLNACFDVKIAHTVAGAFEVIDAVLPDIVLLDIMLPGDNGISFLQEFRSYADTINIPVVVCSSTQFSPQQRLAFEAFLPVHIIDKATVTPQNLLSVITEVEAGQYAAAK